jgi:UDP-N-acetylmuramate dehydrogenase
LKTYNSFGIDVKAKMLADVRTLKHLKRMVRNNYFTDNKFYILGGGTNTLFTEDFDGLVVKNNLKSTFEIRNTETEFQIIASSGFKFDELIRRVIKYQNKTNEFYFGLENLAKIPGEVGAAVVQNIGAYGVEQQDFFVSCEVVNLETGEVETFQKADCNFDYRTSIFKQNDKKYFVTRVIYAYNKSVNHLPCLHYPDLRDEFEDMKGRVTPQIIYNTVSGIRDSKLPNLHKFANAGSFFKNPIITKKKFNALKTKYSDIVSYEHNDKMKISAAWLIEKCGFKGKRFGSVGVYDRHALIIISFGRATGEDIVEYAECIAWEVKQRFGVTIDPEVVYV